MELATKKRRGFPFQFSHQGRRPNFTNYLYFFSFSLGMGLAIETRQPHRVNMTTAANLALSNPWRGQQLHYFIRPHQ